MVSKEQEAEVQEITSFGGRRWTEKLSFPRASCSGLYYSIQLKAADPSTMKTCGPNSRLVCMNLVHPSSETGGTTDVLLLPRTLINRNTVSA